MSINMTNSLIIIILFLAVSSNIVLLVILKKMLSSKKSNQGKETFDLIKEENTRLETSLKTEFSNNRSEYANNAHLTREELAKNIQGLNATVEKRLDKIQGNNENQLEKMRATVEEKLQGTLEKRLSQSFKQVEDNLRQVHKGLGEMQNLAQGVGDLKKVLTNVKSRGTWGELQLGNILEEVLIPEQYDKNVAIKGKNRVEYAIKLPGQGLDKNECIYLPIDSKFPQEDYQRLLEAQEQSNLDAVQVASSSLEASIKREARSIKDKYLAPPKTTDFAILFLPTEGLYAEILRRPGLVESVQRDFHIIVTGPTNFAGLLNALSVGFRTLAIQERSSEVWKLLGAVKNHFGKFSDLLDNVQKKLHEASNKMETVSQKSRTIERELKKVEELPNSQAELLIRD